MLSKFTHLIDTYRFRRALNRRLAARKLLRPQRREAALKGWERRRGRA